MDAIRSIISGFVVIARIIRKAIAALFFRKVILNFIAIISHQLAPAKIFSH